MTHGVIVVNPTTAARFAEQTRLVDEKSEEDWSGDGAEAAHQNRLEAKSEGPVHRGDRSEEEDQVVRVHLQLHGIIQSLIGSLFYRMSITKGTRKLPGINKSLIGS